MNLAIDLGNTALKWAIFDDKNLIYRGKFDYSNLTSDLSTLDKFQISKVAYSSVIQVPNELNSFLSRIDSILPINQNCSLPLNITYETQETLGIDRLTNAVAVRNLYAGFDVLVIDCGTCLKVDFVSLKNGFEGGAISPGLSMRYKALNQFTHQLPSLEPQLFRHLTGRNTSDSIHNGVMNGMANEIAGAIRAYQEKYPDIKLVITGGDYHYFQDLMEKKAIFAEPDLTLIGINLILLHNIE